MQGHVDNGNGDWLRRLRVVVWGGAALVLLLPLVAMQFSSEVGWTGFDFAAAATLLGGALVGYELVLRSSGDKMYRFAGALAVATAFALAWLSVSVGIIGMDGNAANLMYFGVLVVAVAGALLARFRAAGMARAMQATALAQVVVGVVALLGRMGADEPFWPVQLIALTAIFAGMWLGAAWLFGQGARKGNGA